MDWTIGIDAPRRSWSNRLKNESGKRLRFADALQFVRNLVLRVKSEE
jgi:hypothetical protein